MPNFNFNSLHPTKTHAFVDGFACGVVITCLVVTIYKDRQESRRINREATMLREVFTEVKTPKTTR